MILYSQKLIVMRFQYIVFISNFKPSIVIVTNFDSNILTLTAKFSQSIRLQLSSERHDTHQVLLVAVNLGFQHEERVVDKSCFFLHFCVGLAAIVWRRLVACVLI